MLGRVVPSQGSWKVQVGQVVSPTLFWGYIDHESHQESQGLSNADAFRLAELEHRMIDVFEQGDGADENFMPNLGSLVGVREQQSESWVRGRVVGLIKKNGGVEAKVFLVDYGHHLSVEAPKLRPLPDWALDMWPQVKLFQLYGLLPAQIIHCEETDKYEPRRSETWLPVVEGQVRQLLDAGIFLTFVPLRSKEQHILGELYVHGSNRESQSVNKYIHDRKYALYNADQFEKEHENGVKSLLEDLKEGFRGIDVLNIPANTVEKQKLLAEPAPHFVPMAARLPRKGADADQVNKPTLNMAKYREVFLRMTELEEQQTQQDSSEFSWGPSKLRRRQQAECKAQEALALDDDVSELSKQFADIFSTDGLDKSNKLCNVLVNAKNMPVLVLNFQQEKPISVISAAPFHTDVLKALEKSGFVAATNLQRYMWRAVARGRSVVAIGSHETGKTFGFAAPLASYLIYQAIPRSERNFNLFGPSVLIVCSSALKAEGLEDSLKKLVTDATINRQPVRRSDFSRVKICMINGEEELRKAAFSLLNGCHVLVTTMPAFESVALFCSGMALDLTKVKTVVLDDADILLVQYKKEVENMLALCEEESGSMENLQLVVTARQWTPELEAFTTSSMLATPVTIVASGFELLSFGHIRPHMHCITKMHASEADHEERIRFASTLLSARLGERRIIVCCRDFEETQRLHSSFGGSLEELIIVASSTENNAKVNAWRNQWHEMTVAGRQPLLITCDNVLPFLCISNADMIVHFSMAKSKHSFMLRHSAIMDSLQNGMHKPEVHLLLDANENEKQLLLLVEFQERMNANVPAVFEAKVKEMRAKMEKDRHLHILCPKVCAFGRCADFNLCAERHSLNETDKPAPFMPIQGEVKLQVAQVHDATHISARILEHKDELDQITTHSGNEHALLAMDMGEYFSDAEKRTHQLGSVQPGLVCAFESAPDVFQRVRIESVMAMSNINREPLEVKVKSLELGWRQVCNVSQLLFLPKVLRDVPQSVVDVYISNVAPKQEQAEWGSNATKLTATWLQNASSSSQYSLRGKIALCLADNLWLQPLECVLESAVPVGIFSFGARLVQSHVADKNVKHLSNLRNLCMQANIDLPAPPKIEIKQITKVPADGKESICADWAFLTCGSLSEVRVSFIHESLNKVFVQPAEFSDLLDHLLDRLAEHQNKQEKMAWKSTPNDEGTFILAKNPRDHTWHRAQIRSKASEQEFLCFFVDVGCEDLVKLRLTLPLPSQLLRQLPCQAIECVLEKNPKVDEQGLGKILRNNQKTISIEVLDKTKSQVTRGWCYSVRLRDEVLREVDTDNPKIALASFDNEFEADTDEHGKNHLLEESSSRSDDESIFDDLPDELSELDIEELTSLFSEFKFEKEQLERLKKFSAPIPQPQGKPEAVVPKVKYVEAVASKKEVQQKHEGPRLISTCYDSHILWSQTAQWIRLRVQLIDVQDYYLRITPERLDFACYCQGRAYCFNMLLFGYVLPNDSQHCSRGRCVEIKLRKSLDVAWPRAERAVESALLTPEIVESAADSEEEEGVSNSKWLTKQRLGYGRGIVGQVPLPDDLELPDEIEEFTSPKNENCDMYDPLG
ncbi:putative ATP-dependent RNA helicase TDRD12 isoform X1 [Neocloeon triangulifer]|uniref:putative ATP-dependent RNA helicase TDRD12 isoform X1 n=1 Tax=Neocloeon triangulifer TaxID=2078957 RepID=UPI00286F820D|nr:putative ATP-dependent RNA helicase TDRD12 isoform X1 [Neocloeon triangulifer]XP_059478531.1 putative ATP-dependent RNA helicase TDRD12 isoform X1 [Neocloeon triangulifer]XP_059478532.1 putative ATP-dependent RNA helicase TDRD12 isoform X1 [Neocloeon triangulifer]